jgi:hypothetical protein
MAMHRGLQHEELQVSIGKKAGINRRTTGLIFKFLGAVFENHII